MFLLNHIFSETCKDIYFLENQQEIEQLEEYKITDLFAEKFYENCLIYDVDANKIYMRSLDQRIKNTKTPIEKIKASLGGIPKAVLHKKIYNAKPTKSLRKLTNTALGAASSLKHDFNKTIFKNKYKKLKNERLQNYRQISKHKKKLSSQGKNLTATQRKKIRDKMKEKARNISKTEGKMRNTFGFVKGRKQKQNKGF